MLTGQGGKSDRRATHRTSWAEKQMTSESGYDPSNLGWRLRVLRLRHSKTLLDLAQKANLDISYLSRLERDALQHAKPKPDTINKVLDALGASTQERDAVYHIEHAPLEEAEVARRVTELAEIEEENPEPVVLADEHWYVWYHNRAARAALGLSREEYYRTVGDHMFLGLIDPQSPRYSRVAEEDRERIFALRANMFRVHFAGEEFDRWYERIVRRIYDFPWAAAIWERQDLDEAPLVVERHDMVVQNPLKGKLRFRFQMNHLTANPRFVVVTWTTLDRETSTRLKELRALPEFAYTIDPGQYRINIPADEYRVVSSE
jgi:transcriptional regulator with XRE-family HTH domain